ncbi:hypothetical protein MKW94_000492 [Papaver nudicaule]|uniref:RING-type domain-containing protein n=1 Tax=Papaver nudicaule TaxID=74823 RepID=A0AA41S632_PAPNU|nr:hypothetical protein [Papaver nudicaule]
MAVQAQQQQHSENLGIISFCGSTSQEWMMENNNGCGGGGGFDQQQLYLSLQQQQQLQLQQQQIMLQNQQRNSFCNNKNQNNNMGFDYCGQQQLVSTSNNHHDDSLLHSSMAFTQSLLSQVEKQQRQEIDRFVALQNERLRLALHEQRKQQLAVMLGSIESKAINLLQQKNDQLSEATKKTMELEECLRKAEMENQVWQRVAKENEAMVIALHNTLDQVKENVYCYSSVAAEDAGSCCDNYSDHNNVHNNNNNNPEQEQVEENSLMMMNKICCKGCNSRDSCILLFPCRHLCLCKSCDTFSSHCPVCKCVKNGSMEVFMSMP